MALRISHCDIRKHCPTVVPALSLVVAVLFLGSCQRTAENIIGDAINDGLGSGEETNVGSPIVSAPERVALVVGVPASDLVFSNEGTGEITRCELRDDVGQGGLPQSIQDSLSVEPHDSDDGGENDSCRLIGTPTEVIDEIRVFIYMYSGTNFASDEFSLVVSEQGDQTRILLLPARGVLLDSDIGVNLIEAGDVDGSRWSIRTK